MFYVYVEMKLVKYDSDTIDKTQVITFNEEVK